MLTDEEAGKLIKHLLSYVNDEAPVLEDRMLEIVFEPIKQSLKRDLDKRQEIKKKRSEAWKQGWRPKKKQKKQMLSGKAKKAVSVNVSVSDSVSVINNKKDLEKTLEDFYQHRKKIKSPMTDLAKKKLLNRLNELGSTEQEKILILEESILNWRKGVFELKEENKPRDEDWRLREYHALREDWGKAFREKYWPEKHVEIKAIYKKKCLDSVLYPDK